MIPYGKQEITDIDIDRVVNILRSDFITQGPVVPKFEDAVANYCGANFSVAVNSATSALHLACLAIGLGFGDILWTSPNTFVASANCGLYCGAKVDFVDIDSETGNISIDSLRTKLAKSKESGKLPKVVVPVHFAGASCDMRAIYDLSRLYGFRVIEDASHAIGGMYDGGYVGNCKYSDITIFSFHPVKIITTGEGGMALTNNAQYASQMRLLRSHGIVRDLIGSDLSRQEGAWYYEQIQLGFNYRMTDIQAALGLSQLQRLEEYINARSLLVDRYENALQSLPIKRMTYSPSVKSANHLYVIQLDETEKNISRRFIFDEMRKNGIGVNVHYIPVHLQPYYVGMGFKRGDFPVSEHFYSRALTLPLYPKLSDVEQAKVIKTLTQLLI